jgi:hypothetical protein
MFIMEPRVISADASDERLHVVFFSLSDHILSASERSIDFLLV